MESTKLMENLEEEIACSVCCFEYNINEKDNYPVTLVCGHTYCLKCIIGLKLTNSSTKICPQCKTEIKNNEYKRNLNILKMATSLCEDQLMKNFKIHIKNEDIDKMIKLCLENIRIIFEGKSKYENFNLSYFINKTYFCLLDLGRNYDCKNTISTLCSMKNEFSIFDYNKNIPNEFNIENYNRNQKRIILIIGFCYAQKEMNTNKVKSILKLFGLDNLDDKNNEDFLNLKIKEIFKNTDNNYNIELVRLYALYLQLTEKLNEALEIYKFALELDKEDFISNYLLAKMYLERNEIKSKDEYELSLTYFLKLQEIEKKENQIMLSNYLSNYYVSLINYKLGNFKFSENAMKEIIEKRPNNILFNHLMGLIYYKNLQYDKAIQKLLFVHEKEKNDSEVMFSLFKAYYKDNQFEKAKKFIEMALEIKPYNFYYNLELAEFCRNKSNKNNNCPYYLKAVELFFKCILIVTFNKDEEIEENIKKYLSPKSYSIILDLIILKNENNNNNAIIIKILYSLYDLYRDDDKFLLEILSILYKTEINEFNRNNEIFRLENITIKYAKCLLKNFKIKEAEKILNDLINNNKCKNIEAYKMLEKIYNDNKSMFANNYNIDIRKIEEMIHNIKNNISEMNK